MKNQISIAILIAAFVAVVAPTKTHTALPATIPSQLASGHGTLDLDRVDGVVLDDERRPIENAVVELGYAPPPDAFEWQAAPESDYPTPGQKSLLLARTSVDGAFHFRLPAIAAVLHPFYFYILVSAPGKATHLERPFGVGAHREPISIVVRPECRIRGRLLRPDGEPVPGGLVQVSRGGFRLACATEPDGRFILHGVDSGDGDDATPLRVYSRSQCGPWMISDLSASDVQRSIDIRIPRGRRIVARAIGRTSRLPLADVRIQFLHTMGVAVIGTEFRTDSSGRFAAEDVPIESRISISCGISNRIVAEIGPGPKDADVTLECDEPRRLHLRVADAQKASLPSHIVLAEARDGDVFCTEPPERRSIFALDASGKLDLRLNPSCLRLVALAPHRVPATIEIPAPANGRDADDLTVVLSPGEPLRGTVRGPNGPLEGVEISVFDRRPNTIPTESLGCRPQRRGRPSAISDEVGAYGILGVPRTPVYLKALKAGFAPTIVGPLSLDRNAACDFDLDPGFVLALEFPPSGSLQDLTVLSVMGDGTESIASPIELEPREPRKFEIAGLGPGTFRVALTIQDDNGRRKLTSEKIIADSRPRRIVVSQWLVEPSR